MKTDERMSTRRNAATGTRRSTHLRTARALAAGLVAVAALFPSPPVAAQGFSAELLADGVSVSGATPGGEVALFGVWRERQAYWSRVGRVDERLVDEDSDGELDWDFGRAVPRASVLVAVDLASGEHRWLAPAEFGLRTLAAESWLVDPGTSSLAVHSGLMQLIWVRPGAGAWSGSALDGGSGDAPGAGDGTLVVALAELLPAAGESLASPAALAAGDLIFGIDTDSLAAFAYEAVGGGQ